MLSTPALWLIGLGNLGQAYLWTLGFLPYAAPSDVRLVLQDFDVLAELNDSTSLLTQRNLIGIKKMRAMAAWADFRRIGRRSVAPAVAAKGPYPTRAIALHGDLESLALGNRVLLEGLSQAPPSRPLR